LFLFWRGWFVHSFVLYRALEFEVVPLLLVLVRPPASLAPLCLQATATAWVSGSRSVVLLDNTSSQEAVSQSLLRLVRHHLGLSVPRASLHLVTSIPDDTIAPWELHLLQHHWLHSAFASATKVCIFFV
jgi:hypothetical protein